MAEQANRPTEMNNQEPQNGEFFAGALLGAMAGGVAALLMTPKNGAEMRRLMAEYFKEWEAEAEVFADDIKEMTEAFRRILEEQEDSSTPAASTPHTRTTAQWFAETTDQAKQHVAKATEGVGDVVESLRQEWQSQPPQDLYLNLTAQPSETQVKMGATEAYRLSGEVAVAEPDVEAEVLSSIQPQNLGSEAPAEPRPSTATPPEMEEPAFVRAARKEEKLAEEEEIPAAVVAEPKAETADPRPDPIEQAALAWSGHRPNRRQSNYSYSMHATASTTTEPSVGQLQESTKKDESPATAASSQSPSFQSHQSEPTLINSVEAVKKEIEATPGAKATSEPKPTYQKRVLSSTKPAEVPVEPITSTKPVPDKPRTKKLFFKKK